MTDYPLIASLGVMVHQKPVPHVKRAEFIKVLKRNGLLSDFVRLAHEGQTAYIDGPYPSDVERVLQRLFGG